KRRGNFEIAPSPNGDRSRWLEGARERGWALVQPYSGMVRAIGLEPTHLAVRDRKSRASANSATPAHEPPLLSALPLWLILTVPEWNAHAMRSGADVAQPAVAVLVRSL